MDRAMIRQFVLAAATLASFSVSASNDCVVLLHGLARTSRAMQALESSLTAENYNVINVGYPSRENTIEELAPAAISEGLNYCAAKNSQTIHFVTHSMGGILVRYYLDNHEIKNLGRVVMIAPPNKGSEVVDKLANLPGFVLVNGPAGLQLGTDEGSVPVNLGPVNYSVGVIAGNKTFNPILSQFLPNPDDGKVSVERTKVEGMADFVVVNVSHPFIMQDESVLMHTITFLRTGTFNEIAP
ncbi:MAG: esterase/lipase family protein [Gammaproteobacteria bacterium]|jgi:pimeloyl-ACP methyl ester carboxylesterase